MTKTNFFFPPESFAGLETTMANMSGAEFCIFNLRIGISIIKKTHFTFQIPTIWPVKRMGKTPSDVILRDKPSGGTGRDVILPQIFMAHLWNLLVIGYPSYSTFWKALITLHYLDDLKKQNKNTHDNSNLIIAHSPIHNPQNELVRGFRVPRRASASLITSSSYSLSLPSSPIYSSM